MAVFGLPIGGAGSSNRKFKLSVRIVAASIPGLSRPGVTAQQKPVLEVKLAGKTKATEFANFVEDADNRKVGVGAHACPWRFGDELCFTAGLEDVKGPGLRLKLRVQKEVGWGPLRINPGGPSDAGEGALDLRSRGLGACVQERRLATESSGAGPGLWCSPTILVPLAHVVGGVCTPSGPGEPVAHVALMLSVDADPEELLEAVGGRPQRPLSCSEERGGGAGGSETLERRLKDAERLLGAQVAAARQSVFSGLGEAERTLEIQAAAAKRSLEAALKDAQPGLESLRRCLQEPGFSWSQRWAASDGGKAASGAARPWSPNGVEELLSPPDLDQQGWICHQGPNGQQYWHHRALGPAPWEPSSPCSPGCAQGAAPGVPHRTRSMSVDLPAGPVAPRSRGRKAKGPVLPSPEEAPEGWVSIRHKDGRTFWHNTALGPAPWEVECVETGSKFASDVSDHAARPSPWSMNARVSFAA